MRRIDELGNRYGRLLVKEIVPNKTLWMCECDCGNTIRVSGSRLRMGETRSCGCLRREVTAARSSVENVKHGLHGTSEYRVWSAMRNRCQNPKHQDWVNYGGRGITVCDRWDDFLVFLADMGPRPSGTSIDRIDVDGNYEPSNCRWATAKQQMRNTRRSSVVEYMGRSQCISAWAEEVGLSKQTLLYRLRSGWSVEKALTISTKEPIF